MGFQTEGSKKSACKYCITRREIQFQKKVPEILVGKHIQQKEKKRRLYASITDESFFFYDSIVRRVWIDKKKRPVVRVTGSHKHSCIFGAASMDGSQQLFRQYDVFNGDTFLQLSKENTCQISKMLFVYG